MNKSHKLKYKNQMNGISMISLIITIIVLSILATITIGLVINTELVDKAKYANSKHSEAEIEEQMKLIYQDSPSMNQFIFYKKQNKLLKKEQILLKKKF